ncbi:MULTISPECIES: Fic family protein [Idiomarina]|jgi:Fic family protein|uniref:Cell filamentation protein Fic n=1 Tax=Idiomarina zobellii TaxID=86103 RepID=A0A837NI37_9GAMM|nr:MULTISPECIES: Fic family protein [Idiomarina]KTG28965.1 cell filamentation protein Fic [Idiomarina sp. H105]MCH2455871.1 Fic family protein [Idiomarina sp.]OAF09730.1 cell filamentation protein Fic [Idiomarina sp. WRN-38]KPD24301.1 cell filamentation protein Fic [Idiomarina zobellii]WPZ01640.1 Fic family protein [Idiomarina sp. OXR-189]|tara:strand:- start:2087 stop:3217 length:1131 start_codon:yes stop_codon:yes gene_type:complete
MEFSLRLVSPSFDSQLTDTLIELNHLRKLRLQGTTAPWIFFQLKEIFHILESVGSARIEGNRTTISEYIEKKIESSERSNERFSEIANVEAAMDFIEENIDEGSDITHHFIRELHHLVVGDLGREGDRTPGAYRTWNVEITQSNHVPPESFRVQSYMDELVEFINEKSADKYDLLKTALAHHRFTWIHPFGNGNGRVVRLLTYALLIKYGFNVKDGKILNPTAVFCNDKDFYYQRLSDADTGTDESLLSWCDYVLTGILHEVTKVNKLLDFKLLYKKILVPTLELAIERGYINSEEARVLSVGIKKQHFKAGELKEELGALSARQRTHLVSKMKESGFIRPLKENGRTYSVSFMNNFLMRSLIQVLEKEDFIPAIN